MLQAIRERITGWIAWAIVGLIIITFALWGIDSYLREDASVYAASVNGVEISEAQLGNAVQRQRIQLQSMLGESFNPDMIDEQRLRENVLEELIRQQLLLQYAEKQGFVISDQLLAARIQSIPQLQVDGGFSMERYEGLLRQRGMTPVGFEQELRTDLVTGQILSGFTNTVAISEQDLKRVYALQGQTRKLEYLRISAEQVMKGIEPGEEEILSYYESHKDDFRKPEQVRAEYIELLKSDLAGEVPVDEEAIANYYRQHAQEFGTEERRQARHILIQADPDADQATWDAALAKAQQALDRIRAGEDFAAVAREMSDDPGSAGQGGDLGYFSRGMMTGNFEDAAFSLKVGELSEPVKSPFGYHIIEVTDIEESDVKPLAEVRDEIADQLRAGQLEDLFLDRAEILANTSFENPGTLGVAAEALGLKVKESDWFSRDGGEGIGAYSQVVNAVFSPDVLDGGNNSEPLEVEPGHLVVLRILEHEPSRYRELSEVREGVVEALRRDQAVKLALEKGEELKARLEDGADMSGLAEDGLVRYVDAGSIQRMATDQPAAVVGETFRLPHPADDQASIGGVALANGDYVVLRVSGIRDADPGDMTEADRRQGRQTLTRIYGAAEMNALIDGLRARAEIDIPKDE